MARLTNVDDVALLVQHDVAIVSVLDLQQEQQEAVGSHASDKIVACLCREGYNGSGTCGSSPWFCTQDPRPGSVAPPWQTSAAEVSMAWCAGPPTLRGSLSAGEFSSRLL